MKLLFTRFPLESAFGGAEFHTIALMEGLIRRGFDVAFLGSCPVLGRLCRDHNIPAIKLEIGPPPVSKFTVMRFLFKKNKMQRALEEAIFKQSADAIIMLSLSEKILITENSIRRGMKVFWMEHDRIGPWLTKNPWLFALREQSSFARTILVSRLSKKLYEQLGWKGECIIIPNGIDASRLRGGKRKLKARPQIGCIARLSPEKGVDVLLEAILDLPAVEVRIVGKGGERMYLERIIDEFRLRDRVTIVDSVENLASFYRSLDLFVLPSVDHDPFGLVAAEAMYAGIPTIVTDQCGIADYLSHKKDAWITAAGDSLELRKAITHLLSHPDNTNKMAENGAKTARNAFDLEKMIQAYEQAFLGNDSA